MWNDYLTDKSENASTNTISLAISIALPKGTSDPCDRDLCWVRMRVDSKYDFPFQLGGNYDIVDDVLVLYPALAFDYPAHKEQLKYRVALDSCVLDHDHPDHNPCVIGSYGKLPMGAVLYKPRARFTSATF